MLLFTHLFYYVGILTINAHPLIAVIIERVTESVVIGEGPHWDASRQTLYQVDVDGKHIARYTPATKTFKKTSIGPGEPSFIIPIEGKRDHFVVSLDNALKVVYWDGEGEAKILRTICVLDADVHGNRINDGKCDSMGRLWCGTIGEPDASNVFPPSGTLYSINRQRIVKGHLTNLKIANGLTWNNELGKMYYIDSAKGFIEQYDFDENRGALRNGIVWFTLKKHIVTSGIADGMTIDTDGNLWVAIFNGGRILKIDGKHPETLLKDIEMPAKQVSSLTFGGPNLDELFVTTGAIEWEGEKPPPPINGATYRITKTGSRGYPGVNFKLN